MIEFKFFLIRCKEDSVKKVLYVVLAFVFVLVLFQVPTPMPVNADAQPVKLGIAPNNWTGGTEVEVDLATYPASDGLELKTKGVKVTTPGEICHDFRGISYNWVPEVRRLKDGKWVKVASTGSWIPETGRYVVCANAAFEGTYALFAYYNGPKE
jgi:hypothetical protein